VLTWFLDYNQEKASTNVVIYKNRNTLLEFGGHVVAVFLPLFFNPYARQSIEAGKVNLFLLITFGMLMVAFVSLYQEIEGANAWDTWRSFAKEKLYNLSTGNPLLLPAVIYGVIYILAALFSIDPTTSLWGIGTKQGAMTVLFSILFFILLTSAVQNKKQIDRLITSLIIGSIPVCIYGLVQFFGFDPFDWISRSMSQVHSTLGYSLYYGAYLALVIPFTFSRVISGWGKRQGLYWIYLLILLLQIFSLFTTLARGAWLGFLVGCVLLLLLLLIRWKKRKLIVLSAVIITLGGFLFLLLNTGWLLPTSGVSNGLSSAQVALARAGSDYKRLELWRHTLPLISGRPLLGYGPETFLTAFWSYYPIETNQHLQEIHPWDPHNLFLYHLTAVGIVGTTALLWLLIRFYRRTIAALNRYVDRNLQILVSAVVGSLTAYLILTQFNPTAITSLVLFWFVMALGAAIARDDLSPMN
jgi:O-antigen ligase